MIKIRDIEIRINIGIIRKDFAKYLKFGFKGLTKPKAKFTAIPLDSKYRNGKWQINGKVRIPDKYDDNWEVEIWPYYKSDNRNSENQINIESFRLDETENVKAEVINGLLNIKGNKECKEMQFNLNTVETSRFGGNRGRLSLRLRRINRE